MTMNNAKLMKELTSYFKKKEGFVIPDVKKDPMLKAKYKYRHFSKVSWNYLISKYDADSLMNFTIYEQYERSRDLPDPECDWDDSLYCDCYDLYIFRPVGDSYMLQIVTLTDIIGQEYHEKTKAPHWVPELKEEIPYQLPSKTLILPVSHATTRGIHNMLPNGLFVKCIRN